MSAPALTSQTYLPDDASAQVAQVHSFLAAHAAVRGRDVEPRFLLAGDGEGAQVEIPEPVYRALLLVVDALAAGKAVTVAPQSTMLTTQQAADLLGVSRPTVVRLLDAGELPFERVGNRRKVRLADVLAYRDRRRQAQYDMLAATAVPLDDEDDPGVVLERLRAARRAVAPARRQA